MSTHRYGRIVQNPICGICMGPVSAEEMEEHQVDCLSAALRKSKGHLAWLDDGQREAYEQDGEIYIASVHNAIDVDGYRHGRWECSRKHWDRYYDTVFKSRVV